MKKGMRQFLRVDDSVEGSYKLKADELNLDMEKLKEFDFTEPKVAQAFLNHILERRAQRICTKMGNVLDEIAVLWYDYSMRFVLSQRATFVLLKTN